jgi:hypothetical protein
VTWKLPRRAQLRRGCKTCSMFQFDRVCVHIHQHGLQDQRSRAARNEQDSDVSARRGWPGRWFWPARGRETTSPSADTRRLAPAGRNPATHSVSCQCLTLYAHAEAKPFESISACTTAAQRPRCDLRLMLAAAQCREEKGPSSATRRTASIHLCTPLPSHGSRLPERGVVRGDSRTRRAWWPADICIHRVPGSSHVRRLAQDATRGRRMTNKGRAWHARNHNHYRRQP